MSVARSQHDPTSSLTLWLYLLLLDPSIPPRQIEWIPSSPWPWQTGVGLSTFIPAVVSATNTLSQRPVWLESLDLFPKATFSMKHSLSTDLICTTTTTSLPIQLFCLTYSLGFIKYSPSTFLLCFLPSLLDWKFHEVPESYLFFPHSKSSTPKQCLVNSWHSINIFQTNGWIHSLKIFLGKLIPILM